MTRRPEMPDEPLSEYRKRRRFGTTSEPYGARKSPRGKKTAGKEKRGIFVIQEHDATRLHYDFRLELDGVLKSWAVTRGPSLDPRDKRLAVRVEDHPLEYSSFEGTIPEGEYGGGTVMLWDRGHWLPEGDPHGGLESGKLAFTLDGTRLHGKWALVRMRPRDREKRENWLLIKEKDRFADAERDILKEQTSVASGRSLEEIAGAKGGAVWSGGKSARANNKTRRVAPDPPPRRRARKTAPPNFIEPALATLVEAPPEADGWIFEIKYDGYRAEIAADGGEVRIYARSGLDWTARYPPIAAAAEALGLDRALLDSEIVALDGSGRSDFGLLQRWQESGEGQLACFAFDLLAEGGHDLRNRPLAERKRRLNTLLAGHAEGPIFYSEDFQPDEPARLLEESCKRGLEGLVAKESNAPYRSGRSTTWLKIKCGYQQEFVVVGWSHSSRRAFSSLLLAAREGKKLRYVGRVGSGFSDAMLKNLARRFAAIATDRPATSIPKPMARNAEFVEPRIVVEIRFAGWTRDRLIRQGHLLGVREDKAADQVIRETPARKRAAPAKQAKQARKTARSSRGASRAGAEEVIVAGIALSHPDKPLFRDPIVTKADVARYLDAAGEAIAAYAAGRLVSLLRCPEGQGGPSFFQRHPHAGFERYWQSLRIKAEHGEEEYLYFKDRRALVEAAQMDTLEFHIWGSRVDDVERPDRIVFDLDPAPGLGFDRVKAGAEDVRDILKALGLESLPMISGGKGIHVVVPIARRHEWPSVKRFANGVATRLAAAAPERFVATMAKAKREGRIFIDSFRNDRTASAVAPFSPRNRPGAPVAWPVDWDSLAKLRSADAVSIGEAAERLGAEGDPWQRKKIRQSLTNGMIAAVEKQQA